MTHRMPECRIPGSVTNVEILIEISFASSYNPRNNNPRGDNGVKLIVIDDDPDVRSIVAGFLVDAGYCVLEAEDGAQALAMLTENACLRMMISDIRMPNMSGIELAEEAVRRRPKLRVILISGFTDQPHKWPLLRKPFRSSTLCNLVAQEMARA